MTNSPLANGDAAQNVRGQVSRRALVAGLAGALGATAAATLGTAAPAEVANPPVLLSQGNTDPLHDLYYLATHRHPQRERPHLPPHRQLPVQPSLGNAARPALGPVSPGPALGNRTPGPPGAPPADGPSLKLQAFRLNGHRSG